VVTDHLTALHNHRYFHERLGEECRRASRARSTVGLLIYDIDNFKRSNDTYGHLAGDQILQGVASLSRECCRSEDVLCRVGGEEFAVILPGATLADARVVAERIRAAIEGMTFLTGEPITVSVGVAEGPLHASSPRELMTCADLALLEAKACGKNQVCVYAVLDQDASVQDSTPAAPEVAAPEGRQPAGHGGTQARLAAFAARGELRSAAQLRMLQSLSAKLNRLNDVRQIGQSVTAELRTLIDYHTCRVYLLQPDGDTLLPIAFRGAASEYAGETYEGLIVKLGEGVTGHVAQTGEPWYAPDANHDPHAVDIPGTPALEESLLAVPMIYNDRVIGVVVLAKLGIDQFDAEDISLLQALAASAAIAIENARLLQLEREAAAESTALLGLSQALTNVSDVGGVLEESLRTIPSMLRCREVSAWIRDPRTGAIHLMKHAGWDERLAAQLDQHVIPAEMAERFRLSVDRVFVLPAEVVAQLPLEFRVLEEVRETLVAPIRWEPDGQGAIVAVAPDPASRFSEDDVRFAQGIADITSLALGNARRFDELERAYVSTVEALANALEAQDEYTSDHAHALAEMTMAVGTYLGMDGDRLKTLELGALFHDIGKIGVPSEIIRKPGPLTSAERREMNRHPEIGEQILAPVPFLQPIRPIVRACHERWDGKGYPDGLAGEEIPLEARMIFVCDAYHAMTSARPYRNALPERAAIRRLHLASGKQFDPDVVEVFVSLRRAAPFDLHHHA